MDLKKLFHVLVVGGATLAVTACGQNPDPDPQQQQQDSVTADGGTTDGGTSKPPTGGPTGW